MSHTIGPPRFLADLSTDNRLLINSYSRASRSNPWSRSRRIVLLMPASEFRSSRASTMVDNGSVVRRLVPGDVTASTFTPPLERMATALPPGWPLAPPSINRPKLSFRPEGGAPSIWS